MRHVRRLFAFALALVMTFAVSAIAFAAADGTITVENTVNSKVYKIYKVFDATYSGTEPNQKVAYTYDGSNTTFVEALQEDDSPFDCYAQSDDTYSITLKEGKTASDVTTFLNAQKDNLGTAVKTFNGNGGAITQDGLDYGYYYISTTTGAEVTIDSALKDVTVIDKNQETTLDKQEQVEAGTWLYEGVKDETPVPTASIGDTVNYQVVGTFTRYIGEDKVTKLTFSDVMSAGLTADQNVVVKINGNDPIDAATITYNPATAGSAGVTTTIVIPTVNASGEFLYPSESTYVITYTAKINDAAATRDEENNTVTLNYTNEKSEDKEVGSDTTKVKDYEIDLTKLDSSTKEALAGAEFKLYDASTGGNEIKLVRMTDGDYGDGTATATKDNVYRKAQNSTEEAAAVAIVTGQTGVVKVLGLENGSYYFEETKAPDTYNLLKERTEAATITNTNAAITVNNSQGTELPSTGGIGTTIFYIVGGVMVAGAAIFLLTKRRVAGNE